MRMRDAFFCRWNELDFGEGEQKADADWTESDRQTEMAERKERKQISIERFRERSRNGLILQSIYR